MPGSAPVRRAAEIEAGAAAPWRLGPPGSLRGRGAAATRATLPPAVMGIFARGSAARQAADRIFADSGSLKHRVATLFVMLGVLNVGAWCAAAAVFHSHPLLLGTALVAYTFGLRHAVDADHISAIDNVTRKLLQQGRRPAAVGFFFSLGHSTIVLALSVAVGIAAAVVKARLPALESAGGVVGTSISAVFLLAIAVVNTLVLVGIVDAFRSVRRGQPFSDQTLDQCVTQRGLIGRFCRPLLKMVTRSWHMYLVGLLFGLGFDTASEVALLGIAAVEGARGLPIDAVLIFPLLFAAGMSLVDTADGVLMLGAYGWAFAKPIRKLYYNMTITLVSVLVALLVGGIEALGVIGGQLNLSGWFWEQIATVNENFGLLGFLIVAVFIVSWAGSVAVYRLHRYDELEVRGEEIRQKA
jgi:high-affinity nickel-transport protein